MENKKGLMTKTSTLYINTIIAAIIAAIIIYFCFLDGFVHSLLFVVNYVVLFAFIILVNTSFLKGQKENVKASIAVIMTVELTFHIAAFRDVIYMNEGFFFSGNLFVTLIGIIAIASFFLYVIVFVNHFRINATNASNTYLVNLNEKILFIIAFICAVEAILVIVNDIRVGQNIEFHLLLTYILHTFVSLIIVNIESLINMFREAREEGTLNKVMVETVGVKAASVAKTLENTKTTKAPRAIKPKKASKSTKTVKKNK